jgi:sulfur carrier protein ThiS
MFPSPKVFDVEKPSTLREFIEGLGPDVLYAYDRHAAFVLVNREQRWSSDRVKPGDKVEVFPVVMGG